MKLSKFANLLVIGMVLSIAVTGCKTKKTGPTPLTGGGKVPGIGNGGLGEGGRLNSTEGDGGVATTGGPGGGEAATFDPDQMQQDRATLAPQTIYFGYDSSSISPAEQPKLDAVASALKSDPSAKLLIEGNCDERGTEEYNRSLGERRALSARESLANLGVEPARVATRSYGEDRPAESGHNEAAWSKNRRDEFILLHAK